MDGVVPDEVLFDVLGFLTLERLATSRGYALFFADHQYAVFGRRNLKCSMPQQTSDHVRICVAHTVSMCFANK